jgi:serine/threonine protein kinase
MSGFARRKEVFLAVLETDADGRGAELSRLCEGDGSLHAEVEALLQAHARSETPLDRVAVVTPDVARRVGEIGADAGDPVEADEDEPLGAGESFGRYEIVGRLGAGAMGIVYEARQAGTDRLVALKLIRPERASAGARRRFEAEGRALARLHHPGIAQVYEAGFAQCRERRVPYIAMELVRGRPITEAAAALARAERLELFAKVCEAVHHAHMNGVVHRDLKPANVLVGWEEAEGRRDGATESGAGRGETPAPRERAVTWASGARGAAWSKVLDFGVAKLTAGQPGGWSTVDGQLVGTPVYMSPEQLSGDAARVDHRCDVYALGVMLYELLAGRRPIEPEGATLLAVLRNLEGRTPTRLGAVDRSLRGDLEAITGKAMEHDPARRYQSADELAQDVRRLLEHRPVEARRPTRLYIGARFARRNPWPLGLGLAAAAALAGGVATTMAQARQAVAARVRAEARFDETRELVRTMIFDLHDSVARLQGSTQARLAIVSTAQRYYDSLAADPAADDELRLEIAEGYLRLAGVVGHTPRSSLGDSEAAKRNYAAAIVLLEPLHRLHPENAPVALALSRALLRRATITFTPAELDEYRRAASLLAPLPRSPSVGAQLVECRYRLGIALWRRWDTLAAESIEGLPDLRSAAALGDELAARWPTDRDALFACAEAHFWLGYILLEMENTSARAPLERTLALCEHLVLSHPGDTEVRQRLSSAHDALARWHARWGDREGAIAGAAHAITIAGGLVAADPEDYLAARSLFVWHAHAGEVYELLADRSGDARGDVESALDHFLEHQRLLAEHAARGWLSPWESHYPDEAAQAVARCEARLARLRAAGP